MNNKHKKILEKLLTKPVLSKIKFDDVDKLLIALDLERIEASGSRIIYKFDDDNFITLHKPHPNNEIKRYIVKKLQIFLSNIGVKK
ncbi:MAG: type II toxin-antitoxin system HicA family toxin [Candidatus Thioglobus sp.]|nr:type II toxin-antitoxin system HicA family toxin [Candidatus Thioglobus pontius]MBL6977028.1 type II toxin-antitoxin system HicA family toxin [Candidatus Thioglobus sp.]MBL6984488.1 type II toxin-antitoxin system HicA family toxin [Candidatus Thioglobus sp.]